MDRESKIHASQILHFLHSCEQIAANCAGKQSVIADEEKMRRFFAIQSRQEKQHAYIFDRGMHWLMPKGYQFDHYQGLQVFEKKLMAALDRGCLTESVLAQQLLFEGLGEIALKKIAARMDADGIGFKRVSETILKQEHAHHYYGERYMKNLLAMPNVNVRRIGQQCSQYLEILQGVLEDMGSVFEFYGLRADEYYLQLLADIPSQVRIEL